MKGLKKHALGLYSYLYNYAEVQLFYKMAKQHIIEKSKEL
jgi:hypothetical protein